MAEACPGSTKSSLEDIQAWYIRDETYSAALAELVNAQGKDRWRHFGETEQRHHQMDKISEPAAQAATQGRLTRNMGKSRTSVLYPYFGSIQPVLHLHNQSGQGFNPCSRWLAVPRKRHGNQGTLHRYRWFHRSCLCPDASVGICVLSANQGSPRQKLFIKGKAEKYPALQSLISTTSLNLKEIEIHWREVLRLATSIKQGTVTASLMLKKLASYPKQNGLAKALREIGRIERTLFMLDWFRDPALRRRVQAGLNKGEARNALARAVFMHRLGEIRDRKPENQSYAPVD